MERLWCWEHGVLLGTLEAQTGQGTLRHSSIVIVLGCPMLHSEPMECLHTPRCCAGLWGVLRFSHSLWMSLSAIKVCEHLQDCLWQPMSVPKSSASPSGSPKPEFRVPQSPGHSDKAWGVPAMWCSLVQGQLCGQRQVMDIEDVSKWCPWGAVTAESQLRGVP